MSWFFEKKGSLGILTFNLEGEKVNKLTTPVMTSFIEEVESVSKIPGLSALVIRSGKPDVFIAGADIHEIAGITTVADAHAKATAGQEVLNRLSRVSVPTIAAIHGACLGGGLELALACDFRVVSDHPKTILGLPEVNLGIIPGFGGTQRLPRLIGISAALPMIVSGKAVDGRKAEKLGLADRVVSAAFFDEEVVSFVADAVSRSNRIVAARRDHRSVLALFLDSSPIGVWIVSLMARRQVMAATKGHYPAPLNAIKAVRYGALRTLRTGLKREAQLFSELAPNAVCKNLISLFFIQEALKKDPQSDLGSDRSSRLTVSMVGVLGAGLMGGGIAWLASAQGLSVRMKDIQWAAISKGYAAALKVYQRLKKIRKIKAHDVSMGMQRISGTLDYSGFKRADVVIEAVVEDMSIKKNVFTELESEIRPDTIIASNTSALSITEMASGLQHPERFIGMHFFSPVNKMPLIEIIPGEKTSKETVAAIVSLSKTLKKTPIVVQNCPGFLVNRILIPYVNEAIHLLEDGADIAEIDALIEKFGMPLGPLSLADEVGLDVGYKVAKHLEEGYPDRMKVASSFETIHQKKEWSGKKSGRGFYTHIGKKQVNPHIYGLINRRQKQMTPEEIVDRLILIMVNESARCYDEKVVVSAAYLDIAMVLGTGFPPFRLGPLRYCDERGIQSVVERLQELAKTVGPRFTPAPCLLAMAETGRTFHDSSPYGIERSGL
jgi:3-hydroxyacyl-CoA dehydrogenase/enoyl-CoA hydratase/3-hydroxybutyryl-CoA epimerase